MFNFFFVCVLYIEEHYGDNDFTMFSSYHALVYYEIYGYFIAMEINICEPYKFQFYVGNTQEELLQIIRVRYQCERIEITFDCNKYMTDFYGGKKKRKKTRNKKKRTRKHKRSKRRLYSIRRRKR